MSAPLLQTDALSIGLPKGPTLLSNLTIQVHPGERVAILGANGVGKSTWLRTLVGLIPAKSGTIQLSGDPLERLPPRERARRIAVVHQNETPQFAYSVRDTIDLARYHRNGPLQRPGKEDKKSVDHAIKRFQLFELADRRVDQLSGGEWRRTLLARAVAQETKLIALDEPFAHLDPGALDRGLETLFNDTLRDRALLCVLQDINVAANYFDRVILVNNEGIRANAKPEDALTEETLETIFQAPIQMAPNPFTGQPNAFVRKQNEP